MNGSGGPLRMRAKMTMVLLVLTLVGSVITTALNPTGRARPDSAATTVSDLLFGTVALMAAVSFLVWLWTARANLDHAGLRWARGWTFWAWIVPGANVVIPVLVISEIDRASAPASGRRIFTAWAVAWTLSTALTYVSLAVSLPPAMFVVSTVLEVAAGIPCVLLVRRITAGQLDGSVRPVAGVLS